MNRYKLVMCSQGGTRKDMYTDLDYDKAVEIAEGFGWIACPDGGYEWDIEIEEYEEVG